MQPAIPLALAALAGQVLPRTPREERAKQAWSPGAEPGPAGSLRYAP